MSDGESAASVARRDSDARLIAWGQFILVVVGIVVAGYLSYTYTSGSSIVCGPVGDCEGVRASAYAGVMGIPVPVIGLVSFIVYGVLLAGRLRLAGNLSYLAMLGMIVVAVAGLIFSWYLTYVELFVIRAVCTWCLASAFVITVLAYLTGEDAWRELA